jgi:uroporphyrinogen decarboxylase
MPVDRPPVWLMRQAGRYLPEYREVRSQHDFWEMMRTPGLAAEVTLQPIHRFGMDAAILFCDILVVLDALGSEVEYAKGGPVVRPLVRSEPDLERLLPVNCQESFGYVTEAVQLLCAELHPERALIGFAGAPFTLAAYLMEDGPSRSLETLRKMTGDKPELFKGILERITDVVVGLLSLQVEAGVDAVQIFDTWAGRLSQEEYTELALPYARSVVERLQGLGVPVILYVRNALDNLEAASSSGCQVLSVDSSVRLADARTRLGNGQALQGNFAPASLKEPPDRIRRQVHAAIESVGTTGYIVNLGEGLTPDTPVEGVGALVNAVREWPA